MSADVAALQTSDDAVLGGRLILRQPLKGHRFGHDAILLAAATAAKSGELAIDLGAGVGAAGLALAARIPGLRIILAEIDPELCALAAHNAQRNGLAGRSRAATLDVTDFETFAGAGLAPLSADRVLMNPPFNAPSHASPDPGRRAAYAARPDTLVRWVAAAAYLLKPAGILTLIWRADGLGAVLEALTPAFGGIAVLPVLPCEGAAPIRVLVRAKKGARAPLKELPSLALNNAHGKLTAAAEAVLRVGATLALAFPEMPAAPG
jgi:tRNA1(Val) A37 N6-methylase TrmN6